MLDAALGLFIDKGFEAARGDDLTPRARVSKATLDLCLHSKEDLRTALTARRFSSGIAVSLDEDPDTNEAVGVESRGEAPQVGGVHASAKAGSRDVVWLDCHLTGEGVGSVNHPKFKVQSVRPVGGD